MVLELATSCRIRIPHANPIMAMAQAAASVVAGGTFMNCAIFFAVIALQPDCTLELIELRSDLA
jgi:hypothetical protein